jgi:hypothetical protein
MSSIGKGRKARTGHARILDVDEIMPAPENDKIYRPVDPKDPAILELSDSIRTLGFRGSIIVSRDGYILSGHRRYVAAKLAGLTEIPCTIENIKRRIRTGVNHEFVKRLEMYNRQREKTLDEKLREAVVKANPIDAHRVIAEYRKARARFDGSNVIELRGFRRRAEISAAKEPMMRATRKIVHSLREYQPLSIRVIHYKLLNDPPLRHASKPESTYQNDKASYKDLCDLLARMRLTGEIPFEAIEDETRPISILNCYQDAGRFIGNETDNLLKGYYRDLLQSQPHHIEIVYEKLTGRSFVQPTAMNYCIPLTIGRGFCSLPPRVAMAKRYRASGKGKLIVLAMSDLDPDGDEITHSFARSMRDDFAIDVECIKAALTMDQVKERCVPPNKLKAKTGSASYPRYFAKYQTNDVYELEALEPESQKELLEDAILSVLDVEAYNHEVSKEVEEAAFLDETRQRALLAMGAA